jgi:hypothetical protein
MSEFKKGDSVLYEIIIHAHNGKRITETKGIVEESHPGAPTCKVRLFSANRSEVVRVLKKKLRHAANATA